MVHKHKNTSLEGGGGYTSCSSVRCVRMTISPETPTEAHTESKSGTTSTEAKNVTMGLLTFETLQNPDDNNMSCIHTAKVSIERAWHARERRVCVWCLFLVIQKLYS